MIQKILSFVRNITSKISLKDLYPYMILGVLFLYMEHRVSVAQREVLSVVGASSDTTRVRIDNLGRKFSETSQIRVADPKIFLNLKTDDKIVKDLQDEVKSLKGKLVEGSSITQFKDKIGIDTATVNGKFSDSWVNIDNSIPNRSRVDFRNDYSIALIKEKGQYVAQVRNNSPYSSGIDSIKSYVKIPGEFSGWVLGAGAGYDPIRGYVYPAIGVFKPILKLF